MGLFLSNERAASCNARDPPGVSNICLRAGGAPLGRSTVPPPGSSKVRAAASVGTAEHAALPESQEPIALVAPPGTAGAGRPGGGVRRGGVVRGDVCKLKAAELTMLVCVVSSLPALRGESVSRATAAGSQTGTCTLQSGVSAARRVSASLVTSASQVVCVSDWPKRDGGSPPSMFPSSATRGGTTSCSPVGMSSAASSSASVKAAACEPVFRRSR
mmetsp:Transcript_13900/g.28193  ORF Transcript_13900/g.28193 Transcript_13900/m.28193 type:complete len:216 (+) Transcript_13900:619-1266(+)